jgi:hypothetical protein|nr:MAG TPA: putative small protein [Inoviridae sp.]
MYLIKHYLGVNKNCGISNQSSGVTEIPNLHRALFKQYIWRYKMTRKQKNLFNVGDIVKLKSGGPDMTVQAVEKSSTGLTIDAPREFNGYYTCQWFAGKKLEKGRFPEESLESVNK